MDHVRRVPCQSDPVRPTLDHVRGRSLPGEPAAGFARAIGRLRAVPLRPEVCLTEVPAPQRIAPYAVALSAEVVGVAGEAELASGRFVLLHDPAGQEPWGGTFRIVSFVRACVEMEMATDPVLAEVAWSWLTEALDEQRASWLAPSGTVTRTASQSFGSLQDRLPVGEVEVRASWSPGDLELGAHLTAWAGLLAHLGGLPPIPAGVAVLGRAREARRR